MLRSITLKQFQAGNKNVFKAVFEAYYVQLLYFGKRYLNDDFVAEDIVQDCFLSLWERRKEVTDLSTVRAFLYVSLRNRCLNYIRDQKKKEAHHENLLQESELTSFFEQSFIEEETTSTLLSVLNQMSDQGKNVCLLIMDGLKNTEIAEQLGITVSTVKYHKIKAKDVLKSLYNKKNF